MEKENDDSILVTGSDGYIGHALTLRLLDKGYRVVGVDNYARRQNVSRMDSFSAVPILSPVEREKKIREIYGNNFSFYKIDISREYDKLVQIIKKYKPSTIVNLAQQPSAPYSHLSRHNTLYSIRNNEDCTINCLYAIKDIDRNIRIVQIGSMGEYDQSMGIDIEEGTFDFEYKGKVTKNVIYPRRGSSFYHNSKISSTYHIDLAVRLWDLSVTDIMQGVVYGNWTQEIGRTGLQTRLDSDECFGTSLNRFVVQAFIGHPLTVYGKGEHQRGYISLNDSVQCLMIAIENKSDIGEYRTWNQLDQPWKLKNLAEEVSRIFRNHGYEVGIKNIPTPRVENTNDFYYRPVVEKLKNLGFKPSRTIRDEVEYVIGILKELDISKLRDVVIPRIDWRE